MPIDYSKYSKNWNLISRFIRFYRAKNKCEICGVQNYGIGYRENGEFIPIAGNVYADYAGQGLSYPSLQPMTYSEAKDIADFENEYDTEGRKYIVIVLTVAHLDHDINNNSFFNLKAMCQKCHNSYDKSYRRSNRIKKKRQTELHFGK